MYYYGKNTIKGLIDSKTSLECVFLSKNFRDEKIIKLLDSKRIKVISVSDQKLDTLSENNNHQGIVAKSFKYEYQNIDLMIEKNKNNEESLFVILDGLEDPQNFGSIIRTGEALNISGIVIPKNRSVSVTPTVAKVSTGAINGVEIAQVANLRQVIAKLKENGYWVVAADMDTDLMYDNVDYKMKLALVIGSEGSGVSKQVKKECDFVVKLPMYGNVSSLNAAVSAAILMYQINSNRKK